MSRGGSSGVRCGGSLWWHLCRSAAGRSGAPGDGAESPPGDGVADQETRRVCAGTPRRCWSHLSLCHGTAPGSRPVNGAPTGSRPVNGAATGSRPVNGAPTGCCRSLRRRTRRGERAQRERERERERERGRDRTKEELVY